MNIYKDKVVFITGAASGIGRAMVEAFAGEGANIAIMDVDPEGLNETEEMATKKGVKVLSVVGDVSSATDVQRAVNAVVERFGRLDAACNNAGIEGEQAPTAECTEENWNRVIDINLKGVWLCMKHEIPVMLEHGHGAIVNVASIAGMVGFAGIPAYVASKHGINGLTKTAALEYATRGIRVNAICPGAIETPMIDRFTQGEKEARQAMHDMHPMQRMGRPDEIANAAVWLCSDDASFVTGHIMPVDGGFTSK